MPWHPQRLLWLRHWREREEERAKGDREEMLIFLIFLEKGIMLSLSFADKGEGLKRQKKKKKLMRYICFVLFIFVNWFYFTMNLLYWSLILEALSFYEKNFNCIIVICSARWQPVKIYKPYLIYDSCLNELVHTILVDWCVSVFALLSFALLDGNQCGNDFFFFLG